MIHPCMHIHIHIKTKNWKEIYWRVNGGLSGWLDYGFWLSSSYFLYLSNFLWWTCVHDLIIKQQTCVCVCVCTCEHRCMVKDCARLNMEIPWGKFPFLLPFQSLPLRCELRWVRRGWEGGMGWGWPGPLERGKGAEQSRGGWDEICQLHSFALN